MRPESEAYADSEPLRPNVIQQHADHFERQAEEKQLERALGLKIIRSKARTNREINRDRIERLFGFFTAFLKTRNVLPQAYRQIPARLRKDILAYERGQSQTTLEHAIRHFQTYIGNMQAEKKASSPEHIRFQEYLRYFNLQNESGDLPAANLKTKISGGQLESRDKECIARTRAVFAYADANGQPISTVTDLPESVKRHMTTQFQNRDAQTRIHMARNDSAIFREVNEPASTPHPAVVKGIMEQIKILEKAGQKGKAPRISTQDKSAEFFRLHAELRRMGATTERRVKVNRLSPYAKRGLENYRQAHYEGLPTLLGRAVVHHEAIVRHLQVS